MMLMHSRSSIARDRRRFWGSGNKSESKTTVTAYHKVSKYSLSVLSQFISLHGCSDLSCTSIEVAPAEQPKHNFQPLDEVAMRLMGGSGLLLRVQEYRSLHCDGASMFIPLATDMQITGMGKAFSMQRKEDEDSQDGTKISSVVHCEPEGLGSMSFADPVILHLHMPHSAPKGVRVVVKECDSERWESIACQIDGCKARVSVQHFCKYGVEYPKLCETDEHTYALELYVKPHEADGEDGFLGSYGLQALIFAMGCSMCQREVQETLHKHLHESGWQLLHD
eukprot:5021020-Amphidinium_carterae.1